MTSTTLEYEHELKQFVDCMRYKLHKNRSKGKWEDLDLQQAIIKLKDEVDELIEATQNNNQIEIILEASDVANYAMIIANIAMQKAAGARNVQS